MSDDKNTNDNINNGIKEPFSDKIGKFLKDWVIDIVVVMILFIRILMSVITLEFKHTDILAMLGDCGFMLMLMIVIKQLMSKKGILVGGKSGRCAEAKAMFEAKLSEIMPKSQYLSEFVTRFNERNKRAEYSRVLARYGMSYDSYCNGIVDPTQLQQQGMRDVEKAKYLHITVNDLTGAGIMRKNSDKTLGRNIQQYSTSKSLLDIVFTLGLVLTVGLFAAKLVGDFSWANLIWSIVEMVSLLMRGAMSFISAYMFMSEEYANRLIRQTNLLIEFDNTNVEVLTVNDNNNIKELQEDSNNV